MLMFIFGGVGFFYLLISFFFFGQRTVKWLVCYLIVLYSHCQGLWSWIRVLESSTGRSSTSHIYWSSCGTPGWTVRGWPCFTVCSHVAETHDDWKPRWEYSLSLEICKWTTPDVYVWWLKWTEVRFIRWQLRFIIFVLTWRYSSLALSFFMHTDLILWGMSVLFSILFSILWVNVSSSSNVPRKCSVK